MIVIVADMFVGSDKANHISVFCFGSNINCAEKIRTLSLGEEILFFNIY